MKPLCNYCLSTTNSCNDIESETCENMQTFRDDIEFGNKVLEYCKQFEGTDKYNVAMLAIEFGYNLAKTEKS